MISQVLSLVNSFDNGMNANVSSNNTINSVDGTSFNDLLNSTSTKKTVDIKEDITLSSKTSKSFALVNKPQTNNQGLESKKIENTGDIQNVNSDNSKNSVTSSTEKVAELVDNVKKKIQEAMDISKEDLEKMMEVLGLGVMDLFDPAQLQQLMLMSTGNNDATILLTNEDLSNTYAELINSIQELMNHSGLSKENIQEIVDSESYADYMTQTLDGQIDSSDVVELNKDLSNVKSTKVDKLNDQSEIDESMNVSSKEKISYSVERNSEADTETDSETESRSEANHEESVLKKESTSGVDQFLNQVTASVTHVETDFSGQVSTMTTIREIANQIVEEIKVVIKPTQTSMELQLNPENLGKVNLSITAKEGIMTAQFTTQTVAAKEAIESQMQVLKQSLENQGVKVATIEVKVSEFSFNQNNDSSKRQETESNKTKRAFRMDMLEDFEIEEETKALSSGLIDVNSSNIDYSA